MLKEKLQILAGVMFAVGAIEASTLVHFTFDDGTVGDSIADGATVVNVANPGVHDATAYGLNNTSLYPASVNMPSWTNGIPSAYRYYDHAANALVPTKDRALRFKATNTGGSSGVLQVENSDDLHPESFTVEATVHYPEGVGYTAGWNVIAVHPAFMPCVNADAWGMRLVNGKLTVRFTAPQTFTNNVKAASNTEFQTGDTLKDGFWHHVAFTCSPDSSDATKTTVKLYVDYVLKQTATLSFRPQFSGESNCPIWIGANRQTQGHFTGEIGEFRISDEALEPSQFLHPRNALDDLDVVIHYDFESMQDSWFGATDKVVNIASPGFMDGSFNRKDLGDAGVYPCLTNDSPAELLRTERASFDKYTSTNCLVNTYTNDSAKQTGAYLSVTPLDDWFSKTNFTVECFYRSNGTIGQYTPFIFRWGGVNVQFNLGVGANAGRLYGVVCPAGATAVAHQIQAYDTTRSDDSEWHHGAMVVRQGESVQIYRDWSSTPVVTQTLTTNLYPNATTSSKPLLYISGGAGRNVFNGRLDEVRITLRALEPEEFICPFKDAGTMILIK